MVLVTREVERKKGGKGERQREGGEMVREREGKCEIKKGRQTRG